MSTIFLIAALALPVPGNTPSPPNFGIGIEKPKLYACTWFNNGDVFWVSNGVMCYYTFETDTSACGDAQGGWSPDESDGPPCGASMP